MTDLLSGKVAIVTGGTRGIGKAIVETFALQGANVVFTYLNSHEQARQMAEELSNAQVVVTGVKSDAGNFEESAKMVEDVIAKFGKIDVLVNNAGITRDNLLLRMTEEQFDEVINANLKSVFNFTKQVSKHMLRAKQGSIINITSIIGLKGQAGQANYAASKAGIIGFTKSIADEFGSRNIRCNAVSPGFIETDMTDVLADDVKSAILKQIPFKRMGSAQEVANAVLFLASDLSTYISGQILSVCGAMSR